MSDPCTQGPAFVRIEHKIDSIGNVVAQIAVQRNDIEHLDKSIADLRNWMIKHETRIQELEKAPGSAASRAWVVLYTSGVGSIFGLLVWLVKNGAAHG